MKFAAIESGGKDEVGRFYAMESTCGLYRLSRVVLNGTDSYEISHLENGTWRYINRAEDRQGAMAIAERHNVEQMV